jgi:hypothetical protein
VASQIARRAELFCALPDARLFDAAAVRALDTAVPLPENFKNNQKTK